MTMPQLPAEWQDATVLDGLDLVDKSELVGQPFRIMGVWFETSRQGVSYVYVDGERGDGTTFCFNDSSTGARAQLVSYLTRIGKEDAVDNPDMYVSMNLVAPRGLRVSTFEVKDERGRPKQARTYYLTTSGKRQTAAPAEKPDEKPARPRSAKPAA